MVQKDTSIASPPQPRPSSSKLSGTTIALLAIVIIASLLPILLRGGAVRLPVFSTSRPYLSFSTRSSLGDGMSATSTQLSPKELKEWNHLAEGMDRYHTHFRWEFNRIYKLADGSFHKEGMNLPRFIREAAQLSAHLDMHHRIEAHIFPLLGKKMPQFKAGARESGEHLKSHKQIHDGLDRYDKFLRDVQETPSSYNPDELRRILDSFRDVLFRHLDEEVHDLGGQSLRDAGFTLKELRQIPM